MAIVNPGIPNGGFAVSTPPAPRARVRNPGIPNGGFVPPPAPTAPATPPAFQQSLTNYAPAADYGTYSNYARVNTPAWANANGISMATLGNFMGSSNTPWTAQQLAQANAISPGLANYMIGRQGFNGADTQFMQSAGFTNAPGSQTMMNQAGRNWMFANDPTYGGAARNAAGNRLLFGLTANGTPYSYTYASRGQPGFNEWAQTGQGPTPSGVNVYSQFAPQAGSYMANLGKILPQTQTTPSAQTASTSVDQTANPYGAGYTGYGNTHISSGPAPSTGGGVTNTNPTGAGPQGQAPGTAGSFVAGPPTVTTTNTNTSAIPRSHISNPAVGMPNVGLNGLPNNSGAIPNKNIMPVAPAPRVSGNYNTALNTNLAQVRA